MRQISSAEPIEYLPSRLGKMRSRRPCLESSAKMGPVVSVAGPDSAIGSSTSVAKVRIASSSKSGAAASARSWDCRSVIRVLFCQCAFIDFHDPGQGQGCCTELPTARNLVPGQMRSAEGRELVRGGVRAGFADDDPVDSFAPGF